MSLLNVPIGANAPETVNVIVEIPRMSSNKYEMDPELGVMRLDRVLYSPLHYPFDYGFVPQTKYLDGDPVDVLVLVSNPTFPGVVVDAHPIGVMEMRDEGKPDEKVICVASKDPRFGYRRTLEELNRHTMLEVQHFFEVYKQLENKTVEILGWKGRDEALRIIREYSLVEIG
jgi:inorganic pyrophosphatase